MKCYRPAFLLYHLSHKEKSVNYQFINWYRYNLLTYTIAIPPIPKSRKKADWWDSGLKAVPPDFAPVPQLEAAPAVGLSGGGTGGMAKIAFFLFFIFVAICRANPSFWRARAAP
ncbi:hypothetical protein ACQE3D_09680 [Methylomonas sp. MS20]|uniref:hypothetical protein n=1 Tax=unclassified Methylomonas TaxID=2608980 RepID=UPI0028A4E0A4|nr:hypothetical protein [Methylomonas sp. MV1]MDT4328731.1 hypothetical protein [Methylomonas sp. MV1]